VRAGLQVTIFPVATGRTGTDPVLGGAADFDLELVEHRALDGDIQELVYRPTARQPLDTARIARRSRERDRADAI
jgi:hypothetical protein